MLSLAWTCSDYIVTKWSQQLSLLFNMLIYLYIAASTGYYTHVCPSHVFDIILYSSQTIVLFYRTGLHLGVKKSTPASLCQNLIVRNVCGHIKFTHTQTAWLWWSCIWSETDLNFTAPYTVYLLLLSIPMMSVCIAFVYDRFIHRLLTYFQACSTVLIRWKTFNMLIWYMYMYLFNYYFEYHSPYFAKIAQVKALWLSIYM